MGVVLDKLALAERVREMSLLMAEVSGELAYYGGFDREYQQHADELANAAAIAYAWAESIREDAGQAST